MSLHTTWGIQFLNGWDDALEVQEIVLLIYLVEL